MQWQYVIFLFAVIAFGDALPQRQFPNQGFEFNPFNPFIPQQQQFGQRPTQFGQRPTQFENPQRQEPFPGQFGGNVGNTQQQQFPVTTEAPAATTPGPEFYRCLEQCPALSQYSPICGSDGTAYHNEQKLACANQCGQRTNPNWQTIVGTRSGSCTPGGRPFVPSPIQ